MDIRFVSTLTAEDEDRIAPSVLRAITTLLDQFSLAYTLRIETTGERVFQHHHPAVTPHGGPPRRGLDPQMLERVISQGS